MSVFDQREADVLAYYTREIVGHVETEPLAGLSLAAFRATRERLIRKGALTRTQGGRYAPTAALGAS